ncbi:hypothetical protein [Chroococcidiopsis sp. SAG 2025]|uniref:hypothetical protein n=1 Tax=Chroococcidiopsis sp. SAG 2025 TaxID=171389 RepID=UPI002937209C|nr:hypothetical protein [Chroococcidiopsis sp. SAG 2025]
MDNGNIGDAGQGHSHSINKHQKKNSYQLAPQWERVVGEADRDNTEVLCCLNRIFPYGNLFFFSQ